MSLRLQMLQVASLAPRLLNDSTDLVKSFLTSQQSKGGGYCNRAGDTDLYYAVFGIECSRAVGLELPVDSLVAYLKSFDEGQDCDLIHLSCLIRCWADLPDALLNPELKEKFLISLEGYRSEDGGYNTQKHAEKGTAYACFIVLDSYQNLGEFPPDPEKMRKCIMDVQTPTGAFAFAPGQVEGTTPTTAAAVVALHQLGVESSVQAAARDWLHSVKLGSGGFLAVPGAPMPDLLSTAVALHTLVQLDDDLSESKEAHLDFIDSLWTNKGSFYAHWSDDKLDCEYTYYGLLALGHLAV